MTVEARLRCPPWASQRTPHAAVAIRSFTNGLTHAAVLNRSGAKVLALEVRAHGELCNNVASPSLSFVEMDIEPERASMLAARCRLIHKRHGQMGLPYAFRYEVTRFSPDGSIVLGPQEHGVTCATFVLAVLASEGIELVDVPTWPAADSDDQRWKTIMINVVRAKDPTHAETLFSQEMGAPRFRPEEVAGAAAVYAGAAVPFATVVNEAAAVMRKLKPEPPPTA